MNKKTPLRRVAKSKPRAAKRQRDKKTELVRLESPKQKAFLAAYSQCGNITKAAKLAGIDRVSHYRWANNQDSWPEYPDKFQEAHAEAIEVLEAEARRRAVHGTAKPVFYQGEQCGTVQEYSDTLLIFLLKAAKPAMYRDNPMIAPVANGNISIEIVYAEDRGKAEAIEGRIVDQDTPGLAALAQSPTSGDSRK